MKFNKSSGQISRTLIILAVVILLAAIIVYVVLRLAQGGFGSSNTKTPEIPKPVYDTQLGDIRFILKTSLNRGNILRGEYAYETITTTEKFISVVVGAQNKGKIKTDYGTWDVGVIVDSEGRIFSPITSKAYNFLPIPDTCGWALDPEFDPTNCTRMYEVSKVSKGLKVQIINAAAKRSGFLDLNIK